MLKSLHCVHPWALGLPLLWFGFLWLSKRFKEKNNSPAYGFADEHLLPHLCISKPSKKSKIDNKLLLVIILLSIGLANPRWKYREVHGYLPKDSCVIVLDISAHMQTKVQGITRLSKAKQSISAFIKQAERINLGLVAFGARAHLVTPITADKQTLQYYLPALNSSLLTKPGQNTKAALEMAVSLLDAELYQKKSNIVLFTNGAEYTQDLFNYVQSLPQKNINLYVVGVGKLIGAQQGSLLYESKLQQIAKYAQGAYYKLDNQGKVINKISSAMQSQELVDTNINVVRIWEDSYYIFVVPALLLLLVSLQGGIIKQLWRGVLLLLLGSSAQAAVPLWLQNTEIRAQHYFAQQDYTQAAKLFKDKYRQGVSWYRAGDYQQAAVAFMQVTRPDVAIDALYNLGNSQFNLQQYAKAVASYEKVLSTQPDHLSAQHNLALAKEKLQENNEEPEKNQCDSGNPDNQDKPAENRENSENSENIKDQEQNTAANADDAVVNTQQVEQQDSDHNEADNSIDNSKEESAQLLLDQIQSDVQGFLQRKFYFEEQHNA